MSDEELPFISWQHLILKQIPVLYDWLAHTQPILPLPSALKWIVDYEKNYLSELMNSKNSSFQLEWVSLLSIENFDSWP